MGKKWMAVGAVISVITAAAILFINRNNREKAGPPVAARNQGINFNRDIRPILSDRCFKCHGPDANKREAGLRLDIADSAYKALKDAPGKYVIKPGNLEASELYHRITQADTGELMPPPSSNLKLSADEIAMLKQWIEQGAQYQPHWAFIAPQPQPVPEVRNGRWAINDIDRFVLAAMEAKGLAPNAPADPELLLKRACFDITGLPPTLEQQDAFLKDESGDAYELLIDGLLASKQYGEKMAVGWLDLARYADSHGYQDDGLRTMWPWRDWVIHAFNENYSYEKFVSWQLAGDLVPNATPEMLLATGFNRNHKITQEGGVIDEEYRVEYVSDRTNTFAKAFMAITMECAHCHDHKYDPVSQKEYYSTFAFFNQVAEKGFAGDIQAASLADPPKMKITTHEVNSLLRFINKKDTAPVEVMVMRDTSKPRPTYLLNRGVYDGHGPEVDFGLPAAVLPFDTLKYAKNRLGLAQYLFDKKHPLTARVWVNRVWQDVFGRGLVKTAGDFGIQGASPSHPELLDWLALDFMNNGWNMKRLMKQLLMSATYRQSSVTSEKKTNADPENIYLSRGPRMRLSAEHIRDHVLAASGLLVREIGGPSVKPYMPKGIWEASSSGRGQLQKYLQDHGDSLYRRGLYTFIKRTVPPPAMLSFDASNRDQCEVRRLNTNTPLQALILLNDPQVLEAARVLAERLMLDNSSPEAKVEKAFRLIICRRPKSAEIKLLRQYYTSEKERFSMSPAKASALISAGEYKHEVIADVPALAAMMQVVHTMFNMEEAMVK